MTVMDRNINMMDSVSSSACNRTDVAGKYGLPTDMENCSAHFKKTFGVV